MSNKGYIFLLFATRIIITVSCDEKPDETYVPTPWELNIPQYFPTRVNIPADNPMTLEGIELGRYLFYDGRLSGRTHPGSLMSCATCHVQADGFDLRPNNRFPDGKTFG